jgi:hypothetical protein
VSSDAALIKLTDTLSPGYIYALVNDDGIVVSSGRSSGTLANRLGPGTRVDTTLYLRQVTSDGGRVTAMACVFGGISQTR